MLSDAHLLQWLADHDALAEKKNWLAGCEAQKDKANDAE
jgi:hypothetical protein